MLSSFGTKLITRKARGVATAFKLLQTNRHARKSTLIDRSSMIAFFNSVGIESILEMDVDM